MRKPFKRLHFIIVSAYIIVSGQCKQIPNPSEHRSYFNRYYTLIDTTDSENKLNAIAILDSALNAFPDYGVFDLYSIDSIKEDVYSYTKHDYTKAMHYVDSMQMLVEKDTNREEYAERYARSLYYKGHLFSLLKDFNQAFFYNHLAKEFETAKVANKCSLTDCSNFFAYMFVAQDKYLEAARAFLKAYQEDELCSGESYKRLMETQKKLVDAGVTYDKAGLCDSASYLYARALTLIHLKESKFPEHYISTNNARAVIYSDQGQIEMGKKRFVDAMRLFSQSILITKSVDVIFTEYTQGRLIQCYLELNLLKQAKQLLADLRFSLDTVANEKAWLDWHKWNARYYEKLNDAGEAYSFLQKYYAIRDSIDQRRKEFAAIDINQRMDDIEHKYMLTVLERRNEATLHYLYFAVTIVVASVSLLLLIWQNLRHNRKLSIKVEFKNAELQKANEMLENSHLENTRILHVLAHDLKNPLIGTKNLVYTLLKKNADRSDIEILTAIQSSCTKSIDLINDLSSDKKDSKLKKLQLVDVFEVAKNSIQLLSTFAEQKNQRLILTGEPLFCWVNQQEIWRVISNLISNAVKYSPSGSTIDVKLKKCSDNISFSVTDRGIGIPKHLKESIFHSTNGKGRPGTVGERSSGIGLLICKKIIDEHKGKIWFESEQHKGTTFSFLLPIGGKQPSDIESFCSRSE